MKPAFALDLSRDTIALLHRTSKGWVSVGEIGFDAPDLDDALDYLRKTALGLSPMGMATKIVLPASQILYTDVHAPGPGRADMLRQIATALEGRTPYAVADLVFDWSGSGPVVQVAVVARETLDEAEAFAVQHRLNPVSVVAIPEPGSFAGEVWFGPTTASASLLAPRETVERDDEPAIAVQRDFPLADATLVRHPGQDPIEELPGLAEALNSDLPATDAPVEAETAPDDELFLPELEDDADFLASDVARDAASDVVSPVADQEPAEPLDPVVQDLVIDEAPFTEVVPDDVEALEAALDAETMQAALSEAVLLKEMSLHQARMAGGVSQTAPVDAAPAADMAGSNAVQDTAFAAALPPDAPADFGVTDGSDADDDLLDDLPPAPPAAVMLAFSSRRSGAAAAAAAAGTASAIVDKPGLAASRNTPLPSVPSAAPRAAKPVPPAPIPAPTSDRPAALAAARSAPAKSPAAGLVTAARIPGPRPKPKAPLSGSDGLAPGRPGGQAARSPGAAGQTFAAASPRRNRTGLVFMVLVGLLLISLAVVAAWSSFLMGRDTAVTTTETVLDGVPGIEDEMLSDMQDPEGMTEPLPEAVAVADGPAGDAGALATEPLDPTRLDSEPAPINLAEAEATDLPDGTLAEPAPDTGISADLSAGTAPVEDQDEIFLSAMDAPPPALDALALPAPAASVDSLPAPPLPPPAFGTVYQFDAEGRLQPTAEGILSPDGVMLVAGKPPVLPPLRSTIVTAAGAAAKAAAPSGTAPDPAVDTPSPSDASLVTPDGSSGSPEVIPDAGSAAAGLDDPALTATETAADASLPPDPALAGARPRPRPEALLPGTDEDASLAPQADGTDLAGLRPLPRPASVLAAASASRPADASGLAAADLGAQGASLTAQAEAELAAAMALEASDPTIVAISMRPVARPRDFSKAVEAAVAAAARDPDPASGIVEAAAAPDETATNGEIDEIGEPEIADAAPSIPTKASVAKQATFANAINLSKTNLIGTYGTSSNRYALIRQSNGRYKKVEVGDKIDGGRVEAITETEVRYQKNGKLVSLKMPKA